MKLNWFVGLPGFLHGVQSCVVLQEGFGCGSKRPFWDKRGSMDWPDLTGGPGVSCFKAFRRWLVGAWTVGGLEPRL